MRLEFKMRFRQISSFAQGLWLTIFQLLTSWWSILAAMSPIFTDLHDDLSHFTCQAIITNIELPLVAKQLPFSVYMSIIMLFKSNHGGRKDLSSTPHGVVKVCSISHVICTSFCCALFGLVYDLVLHGSMCIATHILQSYSTGLGATNAILG